MVTTSASLHEISAGERVRVRTILFDVLRQECAGLGLRVGELVEVRKRCAKHLRLELSEGRSIELRSEWAPFIEVGPK